MLLKTACWILGRVHTLEWDGFPYQDSSAQYGGAECSKHARILEPYIELVAWAGGEIFSLFSQVPQILLLLFLIVKNTIKLGKRSCCLAPLKEIQKVCKALFYTET